VGVLYPRVYKQVCKRLNAAGAQKKRPARR
jgi:hypothetical protein